MKIKKFPLPLRESGSGPKGREGAILSFIEFKEVEKSFGRKKVMSGVSLEIKKGETMTILGGSGSGKTVLLKILLGLMKADRGQVLFDSQNITMLEEEDLRKVRRRVGMLFQGGALFDSLTVQENIAYPLREHFSKTEEEINQIVAQKLDLVGLPEAASLMPADLSGGMKKRVALARAIATDPEVILYDEPTTGLDPINTNRINHLIRSLQEKFHVTSLVVTHDMGSAFTISDRLALLYNGKIESLGTREEIQKTQNPLVKSFITGDIHGTP